MSNRITQSDLESLVDRINKATDSPTEPYTGGKGNVGNYHLSYAYGGVKLYRMDNGRGGVRTISTGGYGTKRELYVWMDAFLTGIAI